MSAPLAVAAEGGSQAPQTIASALDDLRFEAIVETCALAESYSRVAAEAAWRGDRLTLEIHLRQLRACVVAAIGTFKELGGADAKGGEL